MDAQRQVVGCVTPVISLQKLKEFFVQPKFRVPPPQGALHPQHASHGPPGSSLDDSRGPGSLESASQLHSLYGNHNAGSRGGGGAGGGSAGASPPTSSSSSGSMLVVPQPISAAKSPGVPPLNSVAGPTTANGTGRKYQCKMCPQIFVHKSAMQHHAREMHRGELKPHQCQQCLKSFSSNHQLTQHIRIHTGEKPYKCSYCDRRFKQLSHVQQHTRLHTGERPYKCHLPECGRAFIQLSNLQQHLRNHDSQMERAKNRPFHCNICGKGFASESSLRTHRAKQHAALIGGASSQSCPICHKICVNGEALMEHMRLAHKDPNISGTPSKKKRGRARHQLSGGGTGAPQLPGPLSPGRPAPSVSCPPGEHRPPSSCPSNTPFHPSSLGTGRPAYPGSLGPTHSAHGGGGGLLAMNMGHFMMPGVMGGAALAVGGHSQNSPYASHPLARSQSSFLTL